MPVLIRKLQEVKQGVFLHVLTLKFHYALVDTIRSRYRETATERQKQTFCTLVTGRIRRYRLESYSRERFGFYSRCWMKSNSNSTAELEFEFVAKRASRSNCALHDLKFYTRDDVSRMTAGKKETITKHQCKMQKRLLTDSHLKFLSEFPHFHVSYSLFCRLGNGAM